MLSPHRHLSRKAFATMLSAKGPTLPAIAEVPTVTSAERLLRLIDGRHHAISKTPVPTVTSAERLLRLYVEPGEASVLRGLSPPSPQPKGFCDLSVFSVIT